MKDIMSIAEYCEVFNKPTRTVQGILKKGDLPEHAVEAKQSGRTWILRIEKQPKTKNQK